MTNSHLAASSEHPAPAGLLRSLCRCPPEPLCVAPESHTMGATLMRYAANKIHHLLRERRHVTVRVIGKHDRTAILHDGEKRDKPFNWKRPTAVDGGEEIAIQVYPGRAYVFHYASLIASYLMHGEAPSAARVVMEPPDLDLTRSAIQASNLQRLPPVDVVIVGYVHRLETLLPDATWGGDGDFRWRVGRLGGRRVALVGCEHCFWGDIAGAMVESLAAQGVGTVLYVGKLGSLDHEDVPNATLVTGDETEIAGRRLRWQNVFAGASDLVKRGLHETLPSTLQESRTWAIAARARGVSFVDPEIGFMAAAAVERGIRFGYLHLVSDNLMGRFTENLSNERLPSVLGKRDGILRQTCEILASVVGSLPRG